MSGDEDYLVGFNLKMSGDEDYLVGFNLKMSGERLFSWI